MNTVNSSLLESLDLAKLIKEIDIGKLLPLLGTNVDISKLLPLLGKDIDIAQLLPIIEELGLEGLDIGELISTFFSGETLLPIDETNNIDETFSFILPEETVQLLDGLLLKILPAEQYLEMAG